MTKQSEHNEAGNSPPGVENSLPKAVFRMPITMALLLAVVAFLAYWPSLKSDFVCDARLEILQEGFITSPSNLPAVLSLQVLGMNITLADRPGQLLFLMLNVVIWGREPWGYRRNESKGPWLWFLGAATTVTAVFLSARFLFALPTSAALGYLDGALSRRLSALDPSDPDSRSCPKS